MKGAIRRATVADGPKLYVLWQGSRTHNAHYDGRVLPAPISQDEFEAAVPELLNRKGSAVFVAETEGSLAAFVSARVERGPADLLPDQHVTIGYFYVSPDHRREGLGRGLYEAVRDWAGGQPDVNHIEMSVLAGDEQAAAFWREIGFSPFVQRLWIGLAGADE